MTLNKFRVGGLYRIKDPLYVDFFNDERERVPLSPGDILMYLSSTAKKPHGTIETFLFGDKILHCHIGLNNKNTATFAWFEGEVEKDE